MKIQATSYKCVALVQIQRIMQRKYINNTLNPPGSVVPIKKYYRIAIGIIITSNIYNM